MPWRSERLGEQKYCLSCLLTPPSSYIYYIVDTHMFQKNINMHTYVDKNLYGPFRNKI